MKKHHTDVVIFHTAIFVSEQKQIARDGRCETAYGAFLSPLYSKLLRNEGKMKKFLSLLTVLMLSVVSLAGCTNTAETTIWKIGVIGPLTGNYAVYGTAVENGAVLAAEEINAAGGINGIEIEIKAEDDMAESEKSVNAYNALKDWGMNILVGTTTSGACAAVGNQSVEDNLFQITPSASSIDAVANDNVFQVCFTDPNQGIGAAAYIGENNIASKVGIIYDSSDIYSSGIYEKFVEEAANQSFEIVASEAFTSESNVDFSVQIQKMIDNGAELVFLPIYYAEASNILTQANAKGYEPIFFGCDGLDGILTGVEGFNVSLAEGLMLLTPFAADATDQLTIDFVTAYEAKYNATPNQFAADAYDAVYILKEAIESANVLPEDGIDGICEKLKVSMTEITIDGTTGLSMTWSANGEVNKEPKAVIIENGAYSLME